MKRERDLDDDIPYDEMVQAILDDETEAREEDARLTEAKKHASGMSAEELSLIDAANEGRRAGLFGHGASLNPFDHGSPEHAQWEKFRLSTIAFRLRRIA